MKPLFCPNCHRIVIPPKFLATANVTGKIKLNCGNCNKDGKNPMGVVIVKAEKKVESEVK